MEEVLNQSEPIKKTNWIMISLISGITIILIIFALFIFITFNKQSVITNQTNQQSETSTNVLSNSNSEINTASNNNPISENDLITHTSIDGDYTFKYPNSLYIESSKTSLALTDLKRDNPENEKINLNLTKKKEHFFFWLFRENNERLKNTNITNFLKNMIAEGWKKPSNYTILSEEQIQIDNTQGYQLNLLDQYFNESQTMIGLQTDKGFYIIVYSAETKFSTIADTIISTFNFN